MKKPINKPEKGITDKELLTTFKCCIDGGVYFCGKCHYYISRTRCNMEQLNLDIVALIERLQKENAKLQAQLEEKERTKII